MKKFKFRLQVILNMKEKELEKRLLELAKVQKSLQEAKEQLAKLEHYQAEINLALEAVMT